MSTAWLQITATTDRTELAEAVFEQFNAEAVTELDIGDELTVELTPNSHPAFSRSSVVGLFAHGVDEGPILAALVQALGPDAALDSQALENQDWATAWLAQHPPLCFGEHLWIAPHNTVVETDDHGVIVRLDPGLAFGTGTHPTTALCLEWLAGQDLAGRRVLDYGCGSGILAIAAACLGAAEVVAVDIDEQATRATRENAENNHVSHIISTPAMDAIHNGPFDIVLANILAKPLIELAPTLTGFAQPGAALVLSGLLARQIDDVTSAYEPAFVFDKPTVQDDWTRLTGLRKA